MRRLRISSITQAAFATVATVASFALTGVAPQLQGAEVAEFGTPNQEYLDQKAELEKLVQSRDTDLYELNFEPLMMDEVSLKDKTGNLHVYTYLTFRLRNEIKDATKPTIAKPSRYNEILKAITEQYEYAKVDGSQLAIDGVKGADGVIVEREDLKPRTRKVNITVVAYNEHGTRIQLLDEPVGSGVQNNFNFPDYGELSRDTVLKRVREEVEEVAQRRLLTVDELRTKELPPYDATKRDEEGVAEGEAFGVVLFNRLSVYGDKITVEVRGMSNKFRIRAPDSKPEEVGNYVASRFMRRVYTLRYVRPGDEHFRHLDEYELVKGGWEWVNTFQRLHQRKSIAYAKYFLGNITDAKDVRQPKVEDELWEYYDAVRAAKPDAGDKLPDLKATLKERTE
jgi:hypothetical protein